MHVAVTRTRILAVVSICGSLFFTRYNREHRGKFYNKTHHPNHVPSNFTTSLILLSKLPRSEVVPPDQQNLAGQIKSAAYWYVQVHLSNLAPQ